MNIHATLGRYLARTYFLNMLVLLLGLFGVVYLFDTVELLRRASKFDDVPLSLVLKMGLLKLPEIWQILFPFAILFSAMFTFWHLTRRYELIVIRSAGFSVWQFLMPILTVSIFVGFFQLVAINPLGSLLVGRFEQLESQYLSHEQNQIALFKEGLWLRQGFKETVVGEENARLMQEGYIILYAERIRQEDWQLQNVSIMYFDNHDRFLKRFMAKTARLEPGRWVFENLQIYKPGEEKTLKDVYTLPTNLTIADVEESFSSPESMSFWSLPGHIRTLEETGFDASRLRIHYHTLLAQPLMFAAMVLLAATVSMRPPRFRGAFRLIGFGIFIGFLVFFVSSFLQALGSSQQIPVILAAWSPALVSFLVGISVLMGQEDG